MTIANSKLADEAQIRALIDARATAICSKDVDGAVASVAPDVVSFDVVNPLQSVGAEASRRRAEQWFSSLQYPIGFETSELTITAGDDVAFSHALHHIRAALETGGKLDMWWRATVCYRKTGSRWMVTHEHSSVPFDPESGKASIDLKP